jgi:cobalamin biosynthesis protein CobD/CbiB
MTFLALLAALVIEQLRPLDPERFIRRPTEFAGHWLEQRANAGTYRHGVIAWCLALGVVLVPVALVYALLAGVHPLLALLFNVASLYWAMGFRQVSHYFTGIQKALAEGRVAEARALLGAWRGERTDRLSSQDVAGLAVESALLASHRQVFAVMLCFVLLPGPLGAILYRVAEQLARVWRPVDENSFGRFADEAFRIIDWLPQRVTAFGFAVVGDFEDAVHCWRTQAESWGEAAGGTVLAAGAGALGVQLGAPITDEFEVIERPVLGVGDDPGIESLQGTVGLVWRALVFWMVILLAFSIAGAAG